MARSIVWTSRASNKFDQIIEYLEVEWGSALARQFVSRTYSIIDLLVEWPNLGKNEHKQFQIRGFSLSKYNRIFYRVSNTEIIILNFFDNRQNPANKEF